MGLGTDSGGMVSGFAKIKSQRDRFNFGSSSERIVDGVARVMPRKAKNFLRVDIFIRSDRDDIVSSLRGEHMKSEEQFCRIQKGVFVENCFVISKTGEKSRTSCSGIHCGHRKISSQTKNA